MMLDIPFVKNENGAQCMQSAMASVLKYFGKDYSLEELDKLTGRTDDRWTSSCQGVLVLHELGLNVHYYSRAEIEPFLQGEPYVRKHFGPDAEEILKHADLDAWVKAAKKVLELNVFENKKLSWQEVEENINKGNPMIFLIDQNIVLDKLGEYAGHYVVLTGFDENYVYYHESGPNHLEANRKVSKEKFIAAWDAPANDNDLIIVASRT